MTTKQMQCADEAGFPVRTFHMADGDGTCEHCGWMQRSFAAGLTELVNCATWSSPEKKAEYAALAALQSKSGFARIWAALRGRS